MNPTLSHPPSFTQLMILVASGAVFTILFNLVAMRHHYYQIPEENKNLPYPTFSLRVVITAFALFLIIPLVVIPAIFYLWYAFQVGGFPLQVDFTRIPNFESLSVIATVLLTAVVFAVYVGWFLARPEKTVIFRKRAFERKYWLKDIFIGSASWFLCYPLVFAIGNFLVALVSLVYEKEQVDQVAVRQLKLAMEKPVLFSIIVILVSIVVPVLEELLFRGCLQSWIKQKLGTVKAIFLTSFVFAIFHFSRSQGLSNLELFVALLVLSCYLGYLYERQQSLVAPIALHSIFNAISISMIIYRA